MADISKFVEGRTVDVYDGDTSLGKAVLGKGANLVTVYERGDSTGGSGNVAMRPYRALLEAADSAADICVLNGKAVKVLLVMYPSAPKYVLVRLSFSSAWLLGLPGLLRRLIVGLVKTRGTVTVRNEKGTRMRFLVLEQSGLRARKVPVLPESIGIPEFLEWLKKEEIPYVVLRFYENLPELYRPGGDLDILTSIEDKKKIERYLKENEELLSHDSGDVRLGLHAISGEQGIVPYYPPPRARQLLQNSVDGPAGSRIPAPKDALLGLIYHVLYHSKKGYVAGIPSKHKEETDKFPENDYHGVILKMAKDAGVELSEPLTMESLDEYMATEGWRPKLDTLAKIGETNAWVRDHFFSGGSGGPAGLSVFMLREWAFDAGIADEVVKLIDRSGFTIMRKKTLSPEEKKRATEHLRGGTWGENADGSQDGWRPAMAIVVADRETVKMPPAYAGGFERFRIRNLKEELRSTFDKDGRGSVHSTDNSQESWEYIEVCFPDEVEKIREELDAYAKSSLFTKIAHFFSLAYLRHSLRYSLREWLIKRFVQ